MTFDHRPPTHGAGRAPAAPDPFRATCASRASRARQARGPLLAGLAALAVACAWVGVAAASGKVSEHARRDIERHRAMAAAHEAAARCLESGRPYEQCQRELQTACKGLAIGKYCGMRHEH